MSQTKTQQPRTRLAPAERKDQILDHTARLVASEGLTVVSMGRVAKEAGVSKALVYTYFSNPIDLLQSVIKRDMLRIQREQEHAATSATTYSELVRNTTHVALKEAKGWGPLLQRLMSDPQLAKAVDPVRAREHVNVNYLSKRTSEEFDLPREQSKRLVQIALGLTMAAAEHLQNSDSDTQEVEDLTIAMIKAAVKAGAAHEAAKSAKGKKTRPK